MEVGFNHAHSQGQRQVNLHRRQLPPSGSYNDILCQTFERMIHCKLLDYCEDNDLLASTQHGFRKNGSCDTALATVTHYFSENLNCGISTDLMQLDFSSTLDTLNHDMLPQKAVQAGVCRLLLLWIGFLTDRTHQVLFLWITL